MTLELKSIEEALREPFAPELIQFKPKGTRQNPKTKHWEYLALPYADKRIYEDRLNAIAFGEWSTPHTPPIVAGNKLVIAVTVVICGVPHTDYGEAFLSSTSRKGDTREEENSATEAYSQAFRRACSQFGLGRYLYRLSKLWLSWNSELRMPAHLSEGERIAWVEKLYMQAKVSLKPGETRSHPVPSRPVPTPEGQKAPSNAPSPSPAAPSSSPVTQQQPSQQQPQQPRQQPQQPQQQSRQQTQQQPSPIAKEDRVDAMLLKHIRRELDAEQTIKACSFYKVGDLAELTSEQALHLSNFIEERKAEAKKATTAARF